MRVYSEAATTEEADALGKELMDVVYEMTSRRGIAPPTACNHHEASAWRQAPGRCLVHKTYFPIPTRSFALWIICFCCSSHASCSCCSMPSLSPSLRLQARWLNPRYERAATLVDLCRHLMGLAAHYLMQMCFGFRAVDDAAGADGPCPRLCTLFLAHLDWASSISRPHMSGGGGSMWSARRSTGKHCVVDRRADRQRPSSAGHVWPRYGRCPSR